MTERNNNHKKNISALGTARTKKTSVDSKSKQKKSTGKSKQKIDKNLQDKLKKRMSFVSPNKKDNLNSASSAFKNLSLLNYMIYRQHHKETLPSTVNLKLNGPMNRQHFTVLQILGKGGFGRVYKVEHKRSKIIYAMKEMSKAVIITKKSVQSVLNQRQLLAQLKHPFIVNMVYAFQDRQNLYLIMDYMPGGDLRFQIGVHQKFQEHVVKFFVCCIIVSLKYMHENGVIHRDIKPQNLIFDSKGYLRLTDMGVARIDSPQNYKDTSGTPGYMAPQVINRQQHTFSVDFFALGVIAYQCMLGRRPYRGYNRQQIRDQILLYEASIKPNMIPQNWSKESASFINGLLKRKASQRLGHRNIQQIINHKWLAQINWDMMVNKKYPSPFMPNFNSRNYDTVSQSEYGQETEQRLAESGLLLRKDSVQKMFQGYQYQQIKLT